MVEVTLVIRTQDGRERAFPLGAPRTVIGRETYCDLRVPLPSVEMKHCEIVQTEGIVEIKDLGTEAGTFHNGDRIERAVLGDNDSLRVGPVEFQVRLGSNGQS